MSRTHDGTSVPSVHYTRSGASGEALLSLLRSRRSVRAFRDREVGEAALRTILEAARLAPSAGNLQAYRVVAVRESGTRRSLAAAAFGQDFIAEAPAVLVFFALPRASAARYGRRGVELYCVQDATIAAAHAHLMAAALGFGSVWVGAFDDDAVRDAVGAPPEAVPVALLPVGYPAEKPEAAGRRPVGKMAYMERWRDG